MAKPAVARIEVGISDELRDVMKIGRRNSSADEGRLRRIRALLKEIEEITNELGVSADDETPSDDTGKSVVLDPVPEPEPEAEVVQKAEPELDVPGNDALRSLPVHGTVKSVGDGRLRHYAVLWGGPEKTDLHREWFTPQTQDLDTIFKAIGKLPLLYHHSMDNKLKTAVVGVVDSMGSDEIGLWVESQLDMANRYASAVQQLADQKKLGTSTGTLPGARRVKSNGEIERWATVEVSVTPTPAEPDLLLKYPVEVVKAAYTELGLNLPEQPLTEDTGAAEARQREQALERERLTLLELSLGVS